ncbi:hypothetical protein BKP45_06635 [Anaerobacillus alkalidiazotrophicus]|uniref:Uncharacterized protein n=1 Tax=Anaerobacillus alkalidiazotrophicus TaxID=472963 RepID=A0A1S2MCH8_9BACI|nr:hypothetical protein [Anaerobacillus alkalidiazotrophicus]OIJ22310.1 hypothetical protein BKP45_06635 [Anaerobacillus alkalidiazotrophicus]
MKRSIIYLTILCLLLLVGTIILLIRPVEKIDPTPRANKEVASHFWSSFNEINFELTNEGIYIEQFIDSDRLNQLVQISDDNGPSQMAIQGSIEAGKVIIIANSKLLAFPTQYRLSYTPSIKDGRMALTLEEAKIGRLPLPINIVKSRLAGLKGHLIEKDVDEDLVFTGTPRAFVFQEAKIQDESLFIGFHIKITSLNDLIELGSFMIPEQIIQVIRKHVLGF